MTSLDDMPAALRSVQTRPLFVMTLTVGDIHGIGGEQRIIDVTGGSFTGERLSGTVLSGGADWQTIRGDGAVLLDVRLVLRTDDGATIAMTYPGIRHGPPDVVERVGRGEQVDPASYYFRIAPGFATDAPRYAWLNRIVAVGVGHRIASGPIYSVFEIL